MISLGIESSAHTFGVGIVTSKGEILSNVKSMYVPPPGKGIIPRDAAQHHSNVAISVLERALKEAEIKLEEVDCISFCQGPGMPPCLYRGASLARFLSLRWKKPLVGVNHCVAHIEIGKLTTKAKDPIVVFLSGGNTQIISYVDGRYRIFGETEDISIGNAFDSLAREMGLPMPGGPQIDKLAEKGKYIQLPYTVKGMDLSFTGILTEAIKKFRNGVKKEDVCKGFQENCFAMVVEVTERAMAHLGKEEVLLVGGVAASKRLQEMMRIMCKERGGQMFVVPRENAGDCGARIA